MYTYKIYSLEDVSRLMHVTLDLCNTFIFQFSIFMYRSYESGLGYLIVYSILGRPIHLNSPRRKRSYSPDQENYHTVDDNQGNEMAGL